MNNIKLLTALILASASMDGNAQAENANANAPKDSTLNRNIEIVKEYNPTIKEAGKINSMPELKDVDTKKVNVDYSVWAIPMKPGNDSVPSLDFALPNATTKPEAKEGFLRLGAGNHVSFVGEAYIPLFKDKGNLLDLSLTHNSSFGKVRFTKEQYKTLDSDFRVKAKQNDNFAKLGYLKNIRKNEMSVYADFGYKGFNYYGYDGAKDQSDYGTYNREQTFTNFDAGIRYKSTEFIDNKYTYDLQTNYQLFHTKTKLNEHNILTKLEGKFNTESGVISLKIGMNNTFLGLPGDDDKMGWIYSKSENTANNTVISVSPAYIITGEKAMINIGAKGFFSIGQGKPATVTPDIFGSVTVSPKYWFLYCGVSGDYKVNTYRNMAEINRYVSGDWRAENTYIPIDMYLGSKFNIAKYAMLDINASYKVLNNPYFFSNDNGAAGSNHYMSTDSLIYGKNEGLFELGARVTSNIKNKVDLSVGGKINKWAMDKNEEPWMMPTSEFNAMATYMATSYLRFKVAYNYLGGRKALVEGNKVKMNDINDLSLGINYKAMSFLNIFVDANNILNKRYESWYGYVNQGFNLMAGVVATF